MASKQSSANAARKHQKSIHWNPASCIREHKSSISNIINELLFCLKLNKETYQRWQAALA